MGQMATFSHFFLCKMHIVIRLITHESHFLSKHFEIFLKFPKHPLIYGKINV